MLQVSSPLGVYTQHCTSENQVRLIVAWLIRNSASFYVEPYPDDHWIVTVNAEHTALLQRLAATADWKAVG